MPCIPVPKPTPPNVPFPFSIPPLPAPPDVENPDLCCQLPDFIAMIAEHVPPPPLPPGTINPATVAEIQAALQHAIDVVDTAIDQVLPECPRQE